MDRRRLAALTVALTLATPGLALGQSAGDEQYQDPFGGDQQEQPEATATPTPEAAAPAPAPAPSASEPAQTAQAAPTAVPAAAPAPEQLPRTGADAALLALAGAVLLAGGLVLRVRTRPGA